LVIPTRLAFVAQPRRECFRFPLEERLQRVATWGRGGGVETQTAGDQPAWQRRRGERFRRTELSKICSPAPEIEISSPERLNALSQVRYIHAHTLSNHLREGAGYEGGGNSLMRGAARPHP
jgi:hypothetical protein